MSPNNSHQNATQLRAKRAISKASSSCVGLQCSWLVLRYVPRDVPRDGTCSDAAFDWSQKSPVSTGLLFKSETSRPTEISCPRDWELARGLHLPLRQLVHQAQQVHRCRGGRVRLLARSDLLVLARLEHLHYLH